MRIAMMVLRKLYLVPLLYIRLQRAAKRYAGDYTKGFLATRDIAKNGIEAGNVTLEVEGIENVPQEDGFIYYPNHQGMFDIMALMYSSPRPFAFVYKKEVKNVFFLRQVIRATGSLDMDRSDIKQSLKVINQVAQEVKEGRNYLIFAEGTRSRKGNELLEFKGGSFKAAQKAKCPIVPCALVNSFVPFDENSIRQTTVKLIYLPPLYYEEYKEMKTNEIASEVKNRIQAAVQSHL
ncbi:MAG: 1-acyl-sn-glycerol-3-phosphate acyltransferase [Lachnospiraceae bacterium]|jgi:1-acyl-sn-glycerol-3-phosphate acyltransferase|nr:1-acyl-sn-glycerol-3-phosphate acyltransferase [Lachnospiraceae bacterium]